MRNFKTLSETQVTKIVIGYVGKCTKSEAAATIVSDKSLGLMFDAAPGKKIKKLGRKLTQFEWECKIVLAAINGIVSKVYALKNAAFHGAIKNSADWLEKVDKFENWFEFKDEDIVKTDAIPIEKIQSGANIVESCVPLFPTIAETMAKRDAEKNDENSGIDASTAELLLSM